MYNSVNLIGRLTRDPEINEISKGKKVSHITLAVQRNYKNSEGIYDVDFIRCTLWDGIASRVNEYVKKGDLIAVRGQIKNTSYVNEDNEKRYSTDIIIEKVVFLSNKKDEIADQIKNDDKEDNE